jgi:hypothetical protein
LLVILYEWVSLIPHISLGILLLLLEGTSPNWKMSELTRIIKFSSLTDTQPTTSDNQDLLNIWFLEFWEDLC